MNEKLNARFFMASIPKKYRFFYEYEKIILFF